MVDVEGKAEETDLTLSLRNRWNTLLLKLIPFEWI